ncbi:MAG: choice-of-anchor I family protein, partial [Halobaculum sp.]
MFTETAMDRRTVLSILGGAAGSTAVTSAAAVKGGPQQQAEPAGEQSEQQATVATETDGFLQHLGRYSTGVYDEGAAEIPAYHPGTQRLFVVNGNADGIDVLDVSDPTAPSKQQTLSVGGGGPNNVSVHDGLLAAAVEGEATADPGQVAFFDAETLDSLGTVTVGVLPDMVAFTDDGNYVLTANEGEPTDDYSTDPKGSVSIVDISGGVSNASVSTAGFEKYVGREKSLRERGIRIYGPDASAAQDFEPEYVATAGGTAYVTLQENNALAVVDIENAEVTALNALGYKDHSVPANALDAIEDETVDITTQPVYGMYQPDAIEAFEVDGESYLVAANEGDAREYDALFETGVLKNVDGQWGLDATEDDGDNLDVKVDATEFDDGVLDSLAGLEVTTQYGDTDDDGVIEQLHLFGARSFSVHDSTGARVFESGDQLERLVAQEQPAEFNSDDDENGMDSESVASGPEPEGLVVGSVGGTPHLFLGLEEISAVVAYDLTDPTSPAFVDYINTRNFDVDPESQIEEGSMAADAAGDLSPEGLTFAPAGASPTDTAMLAVAYEVSGTTSLYSVGSATETGTPTETPSPTPTETPSPTPTETPSPTPTETPTPSPTETPTPSPT